MALKTRGVPAQPRSQLALQNISCERQPDGSLVWSHVPPTKEQDKSVKWRPIWCAGFDLDDNGKRLYHHLECLPCHCNPGPQIQALQASAFEVALAGGRGSAKSESTFGFLIKGNPAPKAGVEISGLNASYLASPNYKFLVLRKNYKDLLDYFERAKMFFGAFGGVASENTIKFPSGARGQFDHMADADSYEKYQGQEFVRIVMEEVTQIPSEELYMKIIMSCRSPNQDLLEQVMLTANPGGPGARWFNSRFVKLRHPGGAVVEYGEVYREPLIDDVHRSTRVLIHSTVADNPYLLAKGYDKQLELLKKTQPTLYKRWAKGDMVAIEGQFFEMFRDKWNKESGEPENACHVVAPQKLDRYWPRAIGCDWGYSHPSAVMWGCWHPKRQLHIYREMLVSRMGAVELGAEIARRSLPELQQMATPHINLYLSHDAFARTNETATEAEQIKQGIERILGPDAAFLLAPDEEEELLENEAAWASIRKRQVERSRNTHLTIINAGMKRRGNMNMIRQYLRWWPIQDDCTTFDEDVARRIVISEGALAYHEYKVKCERRSEEVVPVLQIHHDPATGEGCPRVIAAMQAAVEAENDPEQMQKQDGDDAVDSLAYLSGNFTFSTADMPCDVMVGQKLAALRAQLPGMTTGSLIMAARAQEAAFAKKNAGHAYALPRMAHRRVSLVN